MEIPVFQHIAREDCTGCEGCLNACPHQAITMQEDGEGFRYPQLDAAKCVHCNVCVDTCPVAQFIPSAPLNQAIAGYARDEAAVQRSSSGGYFELIAKRFLEFGTVAGVAWSDDFKATRHILIDNIADLPLIQRSKYVQSIKGNIFRQVRQTLQEGRSVLFCGCPCEVAAVLLQIPKSLHKRLYTLDLVCQGPTSNKAMREYASMLEHKYASAIGDINMRFAIGEWIPQFLRVEMQNGAVMIDRLYDTAFGDAVRIMQRPSCYQCRFAGSGRKADLTLGDYHGADETASYYHESGISIAIVNTAKGQELADFLTSENAYVEPADYPALARKNPRMEKPWPQLPQRRIFSKIITEKGLFEASKATLSPRVKLVRTLPVGLKNRIRRFKKALRRLK